ncbi:lipase chaperone [Pseudomonas taiwanensis]|uniref:lipase secretion chaperone n=1 Tax=Pseudomonas taiwanensis TaxID=470150 RepID=UPI0015BE0545|nr:lipase secretion chaperone [Pseudomonas taiwanensis]NWL77690.1 lipase chaperone [Pseudomonas taiwanensis]
MKKTKAICAGLGAVAVMAAVLVQMSLLRQGVETPRVGDTHAPSFVRSMDGTQPDGDLRSDGDVLVVDSGMRLLFEYFLAAVGEASLDQIRTEIEREIDKRLKPVPAADAKRLLGCYFDYKRALVAAENRIQAQGDPLEDMRARMDAMSQTRDRFFSPKEVQGLFGDEDAFNADALVRLEILQDHRLSDAQKQQKLAALDAALVPEARDAKEAPLQILKLEAAVSKMREQGASDDEVYRMRAATLNPEAADRLAQLDRERAKVTSTPVDGKSDIPPVER